MKLRRKIGLMMVMGVGIFGAAITSYKAYNLRNLPGHSNLTSKCSVYRTCMLLKSILALRILDSNHYMEYVSPKPAV
jgi:hypothetical protein